MGVRAILLYGSLQGAPVPARIEPIGGTLLSGGAGSLTGTLAGVLLLGVIQNLINQVGTLSSYYQQVVSGAFLIVVVVVQTYLSRRRRL